MERKRKMGIVGKSLTRQDIFPTRKSGRLMYEALRFMEEADTSYIPGQRAVSWSSVEDLLEFLEAKFTARDMSVMDQAALMVAITSLVTGKAEHMPTTIEGAAQYITARLGLKFDKEAALRWFTDSPDAGDPLCICSYCEEVITEEDAPAIRLFANREEARFHTECFQTCDTYDLLPDNRDFRGRNRR